MADFEVGDVVRPRGKFKKVIDFLAGADKESLRLLGTFFEGEKPDPIGDAKKLQKPKKVNKVYRDTLEVAIARGEFVWEEKMDLWEKVKEEVEDGVGP